MFKDDLDKLEAAVLEKRLNLLRESGVPPVRVFSLGDDFYNLMADHWTFDAVLSIIHSFQEMHCETRDNAIGETLGLERSDVVKPQKKRGRKPKLND